MSWLILLFLLLLAGFISLIFYNENLALLGILALLPTYVWRISLFGLPTNFLESCVLVTAVIILVKNFKQVKSLFKSINPWTVAVWGLLMISGFIGLVLARDMRLALGIYKGWFVVPSLAIGLVYYAVRQNNLLESVLKICGSLLIGLTGTSLFAIAADIFNHDFTRLHGVYDSPNVLAMYLVPVLTLVITFVYLHRTEIKHINFWYAGIAISLIALLLANSWGGLGALLMTLATVLFFIKKPQRQLVILALTSVIVVGLLFPLYVVQHKSWPTISRVNKSTAVTSGQVRYILWREALHLGQDNWLLGTGLGQWQPIFKTTIERNLPEIRNRYVAVELYYASLFPHNIWLTTWLYMGVLGLLSFIVLIYYSVLSVFKHQAYILNLALILPIILHGIIDTPVFKNDNMVLWLLPLLLVLLIQTKGSIKHT